MKAWVIERFGLDGLRQVERPEPAPGPHEVRVRVRACSLNYRDLMTLEGSYNPRQRLPLVPLSDGAGEVEAVGPGCTRVKPGDRVMGIFAQRWLAGPLSSEARASTLGGPLSGMLAERVVLHEDGLVHVPGHLGFEAAACLPCAALTAWNALVDKGRIKAGDALLVQGTGGVSLFALQLGLAMGARVMVTSASDEKLARASALGASQTVNRVARPDWDAAAREWTGGEGVDHVLEVGGADSLARSLGAVRLDGGVYVIGVLGGVKAEVPLTSILMKQARVQGVFTGSRTLLEDLCRAVEALRLEPVLDQVFPFAEVPAAFERMRRGLHFGKIAIRV
jgi:NADPH:quinone reductase-like Zn-dependent oxidoreductase